MAMTMRAVDVDLRLLRVLLAILRTGSVTAAADSLGLAQPTVSIALGRLRRHFGDPLFVRTSAGMRATPLALSLQAPVAGALAQLDAALRSQPAFDPATEARSFRIHMTDISQVVLVPRLVSYLGQAAPAVRVEILDIDGRTPERLESGDADVAIGFMPQLEAGFRQQRLFAQRFVCLARRGHPRIDGRLTVRLFEQAAHIQVMTAGTGHAVVERVLVRRGIERRIALKVPSYLGLALIVADTDLVATVPARLGEVLSSTAPIQLLAPPMPLPPFDVRVHWHERVHRDPANRWLRQTLAGLFGQPNVRGIDRV